MFNTALTVTQKHTDLENGVWVCAAAAEWSLWFLESSVSLGQRRISPCLKQDHELRERDRDKAGKWEEGSSAVPHLSFLWPFSFPPLLGENPLYPTNHDGCLVDAALLDWSETCSSAFLIMVMDYDLADLRSG